MNIKYSQKKQELREDPVLEFFFKTKEYAVKNANMLIGIGIVLVIAVGFYFVYSQMKHSTMQKAEDAFGQAMIDYNNDAIDKAVEEFRTGRRQLPGDAARRNERLSIGRYLLAARPLR